MRLSVSFFTTSKKQGGTGIGTMIMQQVVELHAGEMKLHCSLRRDQGYPPGGGRPSAGPLPMVSPFQYLTLGKPEQNPR
jgi:hypothetical protein